MDYKMIMTSGYPELTYMIQKIASEPGFSVTVVEGILHEAAQEVLDLVSKSDYEVIISRAWDDLVKQIKTAKEIGMEVVVGGGIRASEIIKNYGMHSMQIITSERTIKRSLIRARQIAQNRISIKEKAERLNAVINVSQERIIFLNRECEIEACNRAAERIFGVKEHLV